MADGLRSRGSRAATTRAAPRVTLTVRLYGRAHELLVEEFQGIGRRLRAARAAQLMIVGLMCERANLHPGTGTAEPAARPGARAVRGEDFGLAPEADAFVSAILRLPAGPRGPGRDIPGHPDATDVPDEPSEGVTRSVEAS